MSHFGIATLSLGECSRHSLERKLEAASNAGFNSVELFIPDWQAYVQDFCGLNQETLYEEIEDASCLEAARKLKRTLDGLGLVVSCIQPLRDIEGRPDPEDRQAAVNEVLHYLPIATVLRTDLLLLCSSCRHDTSEDLQVMADDLKHVARKVAAWCKSNNAPLIRIGFEGLSWGTHVSTWSQAWSVVKLADEPNLGLALDSFNFFAREYCDPYTASGLQRSAPGSRQFLTSSMRELVETVPGNQIYLFQVADAALPPSNFKPPTDPEVPRLRPWSRSYRLFPFEGYLPVRDFYDAVIATGYTGPISLEVFNSSLADPSPSVPSEHAERGMAGLRRLCGKRTTGPATESASAYSSAPASAHLPEIPSSPYIAVH